MVSLKPIGYIQSCYKNKLGTPRQPRVAPSSRGMIVIDESVINKDSLQGLDEFEYIWLIFLFHENTNTQVKSKVTPPRLGGKKVGVFASRSPHRPNPLGLSLVRLEKVTENQVFVSDIDLIDGTPILDIKPYLVTVENPVMNSESWPESVKFPQLNVQFSKKALDYLKEHSSLELKSLIQESLSSDPRPLAYRKSQYKNHFTVQYNDYDVAFTISGTELFVDKIIFIS